MFFVHGGLDSGEIAMVASADWLALKPNYFKNLKKENKLGFVPYPKDPLSEKYITCGYANGLFLASGNKNLEAARAYIYTAATTLNERYIPGGAMYEAQLNENVDKIDGLEKEVYAKYVSMYDEYRRMPKLTDTFSALLEPEDVFITATPEGQLIGYKQTVALLEPLLQERLDSIQG